jgi:phage shock protein A
MDRNSDDLTGMTVPEAKEYIFHHISALRLGEKKQEELKGELEKWRTRIGLARSKGAEDLALEAEKEADRVRIEGEAVASEIEDLKSRIDDMRKQLPGLAARERTVDPDLLEQELLMALGFLPGEDEKAGEERRFRDLEKEAAADTALEALKAKMNRPGQDGGP